MNQKGSPEFPQVTTDYLGCVDGRQAIFVLEFNQEKQVYEVAFNTEELKGHNYPQILGAALGFVAAAEVKIPGFTMESAFDLVEASFEKAGYKPSIHVDDKHGSLRSKIDQLYSDGNYEKLVELILKLIDGCGFAAFQWKDRAKEYILEAIKRGWVVQVLTGNHDESKGGAKENYVDRTSFDVNKENEKGTPAFNQDYWLAQIILANMKQLISGEEFGTDPGFASEAIDWLTATYGTVVVALKGVSDVSEIKENN